MRFAILDLSPARLQPGDILDEFGAEERGLTVERARVLSPVVQVEWVGGGGSYLPTYQTVRVLRPLSSNEYGPVF